MENLRETLLLICQLQEKDIKIEVLKNNLEKLPKDIEKKKQELENIKNEFENKKTNFVRLTSLKKEKEAALAAKEALIAKHNGDLNNIKSNDLYKTCILEIEKAKADKSAIEDEILQFMEDIEKEVSTLKLYENDMKSKEAELTREIKNIEVSIKKMEEEIETLKKDREEFSKSINISPNIITQYERIRENRNGQGLALIDGDSCGGCSMVLRPQLINQATKCKELVFCDNCSRILFNKKESV